MDLHNSAQLSRYHLRYLPQLRVLICEPCGFALQPSGISTHLRKRHKLFRGNRSALVALIAHLDLEDPSNVCSYQQEIKDPIPVLPILHGLRCMAEKCGFLCLADKRMQQHWTSIHQRSGTSDFDWQSSSLQTIFRGRHTCYFIVREDFDHDQHLPDKNQICLKPVTPVNLPLQIPRLQSMHPDWDFATVRMFYHYLSVTAATLYRSTEPCDLWYSVVPQLAMSCHYLMCGILATAATHLAYLHVSLDAARTAENLRSAAFYQDLSLPQYRSAVMCAATNTSVPVLMFSRLLILRKCANMQLYHFGADLQWQEMVDYLRLTRANTAMARSVIELDTSGITTCLLPSDDIATPQIRPTSRHNALESLQLFLEEIVQCDDPGKYDNRCETLLATSTLLHRVFNIAYTSTSPVRLWNAIISWSTGLSSDFVDLIEQRNTGAMLVLGNYCKILTDLDSHWWMEGHGNSIARLLKSNIDSSLHDLLPVL